jgi:release factor glutamine methyltransferase
MNPMTPTPPTPPSVTIGETLDRLATELVAPGVPPARAFARDLIAGVMGRERFWPTAHRDDALDSAMQAAIAVAAERLRRGMPIQYAIGRAAFRHLTLNVDPRVLIPRPETEILVELVLGATGGGAGVVADVGTGSGAIALALAAEGDFSEVHAIEISSDAIEVARFNLDAIPADRRDRVRFHVGELLGPLKGTLLDTVVSNPPYISPAERSELPSLVRDWEPATALFADREGMAVIEALVPQAADALRAGGVLAMEVDSRRADRAAAVLRTDGRFADIEIRPDLTGRPRFVAARRKEK